MYSQLVCWHTFTKHKKIQVGRQLLLFFLFLNVKSCVDYLEPVHHQVSGPCYSISWFSNGSILWLISQIMKTFHTTSWPAYICAWAPANVFVCCSGTPSVAAVCPSVQKSVGSWVDGHDCQWTRLLPGAGLSARDIRQNSVAGHIFLCFLREARQVVPLGFSICIFSQMSFPLLYFSVSLLI